MATVLLVVFAVAAITDVGTATACDPVQRIADVCEQKQLKAEQREDRRKQRKAEEAEQGGGESEGDNGAPEPEAAPPGNSGLGEAFDPNSRLSDQSRRIGFELGIRPDQAGPGGSRFRMATSQPGMVWPFHSTGLAL